MNKSTTLIMASALLLNGVAGCKDNASGTEPIIEKPEVTVVDGQFTPELLEAFGRVSDPQVSPDGTKILYGIGYESVAQNKGNRELWVMDINGENQKRLTHTAESEQGAVWISNGDKIAFLSKSDDGMQVFTMNADGSNRKQISKINDGIDGFLFSPDESKVVVIKQVKWRERVTDKYPDLDKANARIIDDIMYKHWDEWVETIPHPFIATVDASGNISNDLVDIMEGEPYESPMKPFGGVESFAWSPDGKTLVYVSRKKEGLEYSISTNSDLYAYNLDTKETVNLTEGMMGYDTTPKFSPDGSKLAWLSMEHDGYEADKNRIFVLDIESGEKTDLTTNWDYTAENLAWHPEGKSIYFLAYYHGGESIFSINVETKEVTTVAGGDYDYCALAPVGTNGIITLRHTLTAPNEVYAVNDGEVTALTQVNAELLAQLNDVTVEKLMVPTTDGKEMLTWMILPPNFDANKKYPAILYCQGGPQSAVSNFWSYRWNLRLMASQGYIVIAPNRRGLPGFGTEWEEQISGDYGGQNMKDYLAAVDYAKQFPYVNSERIGATGASYGGFSIYWLAGHHNNRFKALLAHAGIFNTEAQYLETEEMWFANWDMGGAFWDKGNKVAQNTYANSPHKFVGEWNTPIMITVGEKDYRIVATQGMQAFNAAKLRGIPAHMVVFPEENHWILKPQNALLWQREFFSWFDKWLKD
ncbi:MAG: S9 family peptidase [Muribaculaceae bacterium]|nr:S9 family peptidase [Muribaculaceae bacterium]